MQTILVVDDDTSLQKTLTAILEDDGYAVDIAGDGVDALTVLTNRRPDLILLDVGMPRMDGFAFAEELGRRGLHPGIPIVVVTADGNARQKATRIGAETYLSKPFSVDALLRCIERLVS